MALPCGWLRLCGVSEEEPCSCCACCPVRSVGPRLLPGFVPPPTSTAAARLCPTPAANLNAPAIKKWLEVGAQPTDTVKSLLKKAMIME